MSKFHIKESGDPAPCNASVRDCPRGGENEHYDTAADARRAFEKVQEGTGWSSVSKEASAGKPRPEGNPGRLRQAMFQEADRAWAQAVTLYEDGSHPAGPTEADLKRLADARDLLARATGAKSSMEVLVARRGNEAKSIVRRVREGVGVLAGAPVPEDRESASYREKKLQKAAAQYRYAEYLLDQAGGSARDKAEVQYLIAQTESEVAKSKAYHTPAPKGLIGRRAQLQAHEAAEKDAFLKHGAAQAAYKRWHVLNESGQA